MSDWQNTLQAVKGGLDTAAGAIQMAQLRSLMEDARDAEDDVEDARTAEDAAIAAVKDNPSNTALVLAALEKSRDVNRKQQDLNYANRRWDRAQNDAALYQALGGVMDLTGAIVGNGPGGGSSMGGGTDGGSLLAAGLIGGGAGALAGSLTSDRRRRRRDDD